MKIFITGGEGFIGKHLDRFLLSKEHDVHSPSRRTLDLRDRVGLYHYVKEHEFDAIVHLADYTSVNESNQDPERYLDNNYNGMINLLEAIRQTNQPRLIYASSSAVYGESASLPQTESDPTDEPISIYGALKKTTETLCQTYAAQYDIDCTGLRFFNVYGPNCEPGSVIYRITESLFKGQPVQLTDQGLSVRDFIHVSDILEAIDLVLTYRLGFKEAEVKHRLFNVGTGQSYTMLQVLSKLEHLITPATNVELLGSVSGNPIATCASIEKITNHLGFRVKVDLDAGLTDFVQWYRDNKLKERQ